MSIIPAIFLITGVCIGLDAPIEARVVSSHVSFDLTPSSNNCCTDQNLLASWYSGAGRDQLDPNYPRLRSPSEDYRRLRDLPAKGAQGR